MTAIALLAGGAFLAALGSSIARAGREDLDRFSRRTGLFFMAAGGAALAFAIALRVLA